MRAFYRPMALRGARKLHGEQRVGSFGRTSALNNPEFGRVCRGLEHRHEVGVDILTIIGAHAIGEDIVVSTNYFGVINITLANVFNAHYSVVDEVSCSITTLDLLLAEDARCC